MAGKMKDQDQDDFASIAEINVTPFVDVVLVLLVIFMVTAPMLVREQMSVNLPKAESGEKSASTALTIQISKEGAITFMQAPIAISELSDKIKEALAANPNAQAVVSADQEAKHGDVVAVMDVVKKAGLTKFAIQILRR